jgi:hypothetical protein
VFFRFYKSFQNSRSSHSVLFIGFFLSSEVVPLISTFNDEIPLTANGAIVDVEDAIDANSGQGFDASAQLIAEFV